MRLLNIDIANAKGKHDAFYKTCVSTGRANTLLRSDHQMHLDRGGKECGFQYLRFHGLFDDDMGVYREDKDGNPIYSWMYVDAVYDYILDAGMRPFVEFGFMPQALASGDKTVFWEDSNVTPPNDYDKWSALIRETVQHFTDRYGEGEVKHWFFEVWNEPDQHNMFFTAGLEEYIKLYETSARAVRSVSPHYRVGGPATAGNPGWIGGLIEHCVRNGVPLDFITTHAYSCQPGESGGSKEAPYTGPEGAVRTPVWSPGTGWAQDNMYYKPDGVLAEVLRAKADIAASSMPDLDLYFTEFGLTYHYWDPLRDSYHAASFLLSRLKAVQGHVKAMSYCEISDVFEEDGPPTGHFHGGFGLMNLQGIRKPAYFAYRYLNLLGETALACEDTEAFACRDEKGAQVLFWDCTVRQDAENKLYYGKEQPALPAGPSKVVIAGLEPGDYEVCVYRTGYRSNDAYTDYLDLDPKSTLSREQIRRLDERNAGLPEHVRKVTVAEDQPFTYETDMLENDVCLVTLHKM
ncbi:GH39 family glycosyl hydrolase [Paenibacillus sacheonensis]|uniref:Glycoside hydrolase n=1 Tax=Paenibacillus sacheonensis TaxID=742054 RepID=A0A7X4YKN3_9BACL|nr:glycoside hydrolase [Paenibacillus sacheonensis]MBM7564246.1 xylan 1,4-beta-xylosidase [Paenibacillus sacheonensis]NBC67431.1 glycoside hydrolase [Paenibacillus sacheonensis]